MTTTSVDDRIRRLNRAAANRVIEPDVDVPGHVGDGQIIPDELLSIAGLDLHLTAAQRRTLAREEVASITTSGINFEAVLEAGFAFEIVRRRDPTDPRVVFLLHEIGEETRHQRLFIRLLEDLQPAARNPIERGPMLWLLHRGMRFLIAQPALLYAMVLAGEEIPDLLQKLAAEHPATDPFIVAVNRYHRGEEARHLSYARAVFPEVWAETNRFDHFLVRYVAPRITMAMFNMLVHPGVYETVGLPGVTTWRRACRSAARVALRHRATRPVLRALVDAGAIPADRVPRGWRKLCGVDRRGEPVTNVGATTEVVTSPA
jgi:hypothetical protein